MHTCITFVVTTYRPKIMVSYVKIKKYHCMNLRKQSRIRCVKLFWFAADREWRVVTYALSRRHVIHTYLQYTEETKMTWQIYDLVGLFWIRFSSSWIYVAFNTQTIVVPKINVRIGDFFFNFFGDKRNKLPPPQVFSSVVSKFSI